MSQKKQAGFTLIELLIVMTILGILAAIVVPNLARRPGEAERKATKDQITLFETALDLYRLDTRKYPTSDQGLSALVAQPSDVQRWKGPYLKKGVPNDPWGNPYIYIYPGEHGDYDIISLGADGAPGGEGENQDIVSWKDLEE